MSLKNFVFALTLLAIAFIGSPVQASTPEQTCLAQVVYFEAGTAPDKDKYAVAHTVYNRSHSHRFPSTICGVINEPGQFSWKRKRPRKLDPKRFDRALHVAETVLSGDDPDNSNGALYFYNWHMVKPKWVRTTIETLRTDNHSYRN